MSNPTYHFSFITFHLSLTCPLSIFDDFNVVEVLQPRRRFAFMLKSATNNAETYRATVANRGATNRAYLANAERFSPLKCPIIVH